MIGVIVHDFVNVSKKVGHKLLMSAKKYDTKYNTHKFFRREGKIERKLTRVMENSAPYKQRHVNITFLWYKAFGVLYPFGVYKRMLY